MTLLFGESAQFLGSKEILANVATGAALTVRQEGAGDILALYTLDASGTAQKVWSVDAQGTVFDSKTSLTGKIGINTRNPQYGLHVLADGVFIEGMAAPGAPTLVLAGAAGSTTYGYQIVARESFGRRTLASPASSLTNGPAALGGGNQIQVTWSHVAGAGAYDVLRNGARVGTVAVPSTLPEGYQPQYLDDGSGTPEVYALPTRNETGDLIVNGHLAVGPTASPAADSRVVIVHRLSETRDAAAYGLDVLAVSEPTDLQRTNVGALRATLQVNGVPSSGTIAVGAALISQVVASASGVPILQNFRAEATISAVVQDYRALNVKAPTLSGDGAVTTLYGLYVPELKVSGVTAAWGLFVPGGNTRNYLAGQTGIGYSGIENTSYRLAVTGASYFAGAGEFTGNLTVGGTLQVTGPTTLSGGQTLTGGATLSALTVTGTTSLQGPLDVAGAVGLASSLTATGAVSLLSTLDVTGVATFRATSVFATGATVSAGQLVLPAGTEAATPPLAFAGDLDTGLYYTGSGGLALAGNGNLLASFNGVQSVFTVPIRQLSGTAAAPSYSFSAQTDLGLYRAGANLLSFAASGMEQLRIGPTGLAGAGGGQLNVSSSLAVDTSALFVNSATDRVGIRTTAPNQALEISKGHQRFTVEPAPEACTAALIAEAGLVTSGNHTYRISFVTAEGETNAGTASNTVTTDEATNGKVLLSNIPTGTAGVVTARKIYRTTIAGTSRLLATLNDNTTTTYTDNTPDGSLTGNVNEDNTTAGGLYVGATKILQLGTTGNEIASHLTLRIRTQGTNALFTVQNASGTDVFRAGGANSQTILADGSAATPALGFNSSSDLGLFRAGSGILGFATGGAERLRLTSTTLQFARHSSYTLLVENTTNSNTAGGSLTLQAANGVGNGAGGSLTLRAGSAGASGADGAVLLETGSTGANPATLTLRAYGANSSTTTLVLSRSATPFLNVTNVVTTTAGNLAQVAMLGSATANSQVGFAVVPTWSQSGSAGYTALLVNSTETTTGSGPKLLADFQVGGVSKLSIDNAGGLTSASDLRVANNKAFKLLGSGGSYLNGIGIATNNDLTVGNTTSTLYLLGAGVIYLSVGGTNLAKLDATNWSLASGARLQWTSGIITAPADTNLYRSAADTLKTDDSLVVGAALSVVGAVTVTGNTTLLGTLYVDGTAATFMGNTQVYGTFYTDTTATIHGATTLDSTLAVAGSASVTGRLALGNTLSVAGSASLGGPLALGANELQNVKHKVRQATIAGVAPASTSFTYGTFTELNPVAGYYGLAGIRYLALTSGGTFAGGETLTVAVKFAFDTGYEVSLSKSFTSAGGETELTGSEIFGLFASADGLTLTRITVGASSSVNNSTATGGLKVLCQNT